MALGVLTIDYPETSAIGMIVPQMCAFAERNRVIVQTKHQGVTVFAGPGEQVSKIVEQFMTAKAQGRKLALVNSHS